MKYCFINSYSKIEFIEVSMFFAGEKKKKNFTYILLFNFPRL